MPSHSLAAREGSAALRGQELACSGTSRSRFYVRRCPEENAAREVAEDEEQDGDRDVDLSWPHREGRFPRREDHE